MTSLTMPTPPAMPAPNPAGALSSGTAQLSAGARSAVAVPGAAGGSANPAVASNPVNTMRFDVKIGSQDIGSFTTFEGLTFSYDVKTYEEGGQNGFVHSLAGRLKYENIKVGRPVDAKSKPLATWFATLARGGALEKTTATVTAYNDNKEAVATWSFTGVYPVRYAGPSFTTDGAKVATETLEFAHEGLLP